MRRCEGWLRARRTELVLGKHLGEHPDPFLGDRRACRGDRPVSMPIRRTPPSRNDASHRQRLWPTSSRRPIRPIRPISLPSTASSRVAAIGLGAHPQSDQHLALFMGRYLDVPVLGGSDDGFGQWVPGVDLRTGGVGGFVRVASPGPRGGTVADRRTSPVTNSTSAETTNAGYPPFLVRDGRPRRVCGADHRSGRVHGGRAPPVSILNNETIPGGSPLAAGTCELPCRRAESPYEFDVNGTIAARRAQAVGRTADRRSRRRGPRCSSGPR